MGGEGQVQDRRIGRAFELENSSDGATYEHVNNFAIGLFTSSGSKPDAPTRCGLGTDRVSLAGSVFTLLLIG